MHRPPQSQTLSEPYQKPFRQPHKYSWGINLSLSPHFDEDNDTVPAIPSNTFRYHTSTSPTVTTHSPKPQEVEAAEHPSPIVHSPAVSEHTSSEPSMPRPLGGPRSRRESSQWDSVRKHPELWKTNGDLLVYLYAKGRSLRGPSFKIRLNDLVNSRCDPLIALVTTPSSSSTPDEHVVSTSPSSNHELYLPVPPELSQLDAFRWHLSTRNFFAWLTNIPLSLHDDTLGETLVELYNRMRLFRADDVDNAADLLEYADELGYSGTANSPDRASAMLFVSEHLEREDVWLDAFVNCVGMADRLPSCLEYSNIGKVTKALITRAYLEMDLHLDRATKAVTGLLERELQHLKLGRPAADCLERFRSFLYSYCVGAYGYWPPPADKSFDNQLYQTLREALEDLYHYLAYQGDIAGTQYATGNIPVAQHINSFNTRNKFTPLPYLYPLIPYMDAEQHRSQGQRSLLSFKLGRSESKSQKAEAALFALHAASNNEDKDLVASPLVQAYRKFEEDSVLDQDQHISLADSRRVQWILVYGLLQVTLSITQAPPEVRDIQSPTYPLCCLTTGLPGWNDPSRTTSRADMVDKPDVSAPSDVPSTQQSTTPTSSQNTPEQQKYVDLIDEEEQSLANSTPITSEEDPETTTEKEEYSSHSTPRVPHSTEEAKDLLDPAVVTAILSGGSSTETSQVEAGMISTDSESLSVEDDSTTSNTNRDLTNLVIPNDTQKRASSSSNSAGSRSPLLSAEQLSASPSFAPVDDLGITIERLPNLLGYRSDSDGSGGHGVAEHGTFTASSDGLASKQFTKHPGFSSSSLLKNIFSSNKSKTPLRKDSPEPSSVRIAGSSPSPYGHSPRAGRTLTLRRKEDTGSDQVVISDAASDSDYDFHDALNVKRR